MVPMDAPTVYANKAVASLPITGKAKKNLVRYAAKYLAGNFEFFGMPSEKHHRALLEASGVDVDKMVREYRNRPV